MELVETQDQILLHRWQASRDAEAFRVLVARYAGLVYAVANRVLRNPGDAEDVSQECFLKLANARNVPGRNLGAWLHTVAVNRAKDHIRGESRRRNREDTYGEATSSREGGELDDTLAFVDEAIAALEDELRMAVVAHFLEGKSQGEIAVAAGVSRQTVNARVKRGVEAIREHLQKKGVTTSVATLSTLLGTQMVEAAPASLLATLGKVAVAGGAAWRGGLTGILTGANAAKAAIGVAAVVLVVLSFLGLSAELKTAPLGNAEDPVEAQEEQTIVVDSGPMQAVPPAVAGTDDASPLAPITSILDEDYGEISGTFLDRTGHPIAGATISAGGRETVADDDGNFALKELAPGRYTLQADTRRAGRVADAEVNFSSATTEVEIGPGEHVDEVELRCDCERIPVAGKVVDETGRPVARLELLLTTGAGLESQSAAWVSTWTTTDGQGRFEFNSYGPGAYWLLTYDDNYKLVESPHVVRSGDANLVIPARRTGDRTLRMKVVDERTGAPVERFVYDSRARNLFAAQEVEVPEGRLDISAGGWDAVHVYSKEAGYAEYTIKKGDLGGGVVTVRLANVEPLVGRVTNASGMPVAGARIQLDSIRPNNEAWPAIAVTDGAGVFEIPVLEDAVREVVVVPDAGPFVITPVVRRGEWEIQLPPESEIRGQVLANRRPLAGVSLKLVRHIEAGDHNWFYRDATTDEHGFYSFGGLPQGHYGISVSLGKRHRGERNKDIRTEPGEAGELNFEFDATETGVSLTGNVREGESPIRSRVELRYPRPGGPSETFGALSGPDGEYDIESVLPGSAELIITPHASAHRRKRFRVELRRGINMQDVQFAPGEATLDCVFNLPPSAHKLVQYTISCETPSGSEMVESEVLQHTADSGFQVEGLPAGEATLALKIDTGNGWQEYMRKFELFEGQTTTVSIPDGCGGLAFEAEENPSVTMTNVSVIPGRPALPDFAAFDLLELDLLLSELDVLRSLTREWQDGITCLEAGEYTVLGWALPTELFSELVSEKERTAALTFTSTVVVVEEGKTVAAVLSFE